MDHSPAPSVLEEVSNNGIDPTPHTEETVDVTGNVTEGETPVEVPPDIGDESAPTSGNISSSKAIQQPTYTASDPIPGTHEIVKVTGDNSSECKTSANVSEVDVSPLLPLCSKSELVAILKNVARDPMPTTHENVDMSGDNPPKCETLANVSTATQSQGSEVEKVPTLVDDSPSVSSYSKPEDVGLSTVTTGDSLPSTHKMQDGSGDNLPEYGTSNVPTAVGGQITCKVKTEPASADISPEIPCCSKSEPTSADASLEMPCSSKSIQQQSGPEGAADEITHPHPLPPNPVYKHHPKWKKMLPSPSARAFIRKGGVVVTWDLEVTSKHAEVAFYQIFAYEEGRDVAPRIWKIVGKLRPLPLPMGCMIKEFEEDHRYHIAVRALDVHRRIGPFSEICSLVYKASKEEEEEASSSEKPSTTG